MFHFFFVELLWFEQNFYMAPNRIKIIFIYCLWIYCYYLLYVKTTQVSKYFFIFQLIFTLRKKLYLVNTCTSIINTHASAQEQNVRENWWLWKPLLNVLKITFGLTRPYESNCKTFDTWMNGLKLSCWKMLETFFFAYLELL